MAYSFFTNSTAPKSSRTPLSPTYATNSSNNSKQPSIHPAPPRTPPAPSPALRVADSSHPQPPPYPGTLKSHPTPHPQISIDPVNTAHIPSLTRITGLLLPIRYPNGFYTATITDPVIASLSRVAIYHNDDKRATTNGTTNHDSSTDKVIGGIRCRLESLPQGNASSSKDQQVRRNLYIQTLLLLSPYRGNGVATSLLNSLLFEPSSSPTGTSTSTSDKQLDKRCISPLVRHYGIRTVTAHVHETNEDALHWYIARGFKVEDGIVEGYYRRLKPGGAKIVRLTLPWDEQENVSEEEPNNNGEDEDWVKIEAEDVDVDDTLANKAGKGGMKRKADDEIDR